MQPALFAGKLPNEILHKINDFRVGDDIHWKIKFIDVVNQLNDVEFFVKHIGVVMNVVYVINAIMIIQLN